MSEGLLFVGNFLSGVGFNQTYCEDMTRRLEARRWRVVRTSGRRDRIARFADMLKTSWTAREAYAAAHIDVFSGTAFLWAEAVSFELKRLGKPYVLTLRGGNLPAFAARWPTRVRRLLRSAAAVTTPSRYLEQELAHLGPSVRVIPNAIDVASYTYVPRTRLRPRLVWVRAFHAVYNPVMAVDVMARLGAPDATLTMIGVDKGDGSVEAVRARARELGVQDRVTLVLGVPKREVADYLAAADIFINTTYVDNTPVSVLEAMAAGLCVVTTNAGGIPFLVDDGCTGLLTRPGDAHAMAAQIDRLLADSAFAAALSARARDHAVAHDWSTVIETWEQLFTDVIAHA